MNTALPAPPAQSVASAIRGPVGFDGQEVILGTKTACGTQSSPEGPEPGTGVAGAGLSTTTEGPVTNTEIPMKSAAN